MTEMISATAASAREAARTHTGQFGTQPLAEAELELTSDATAGHDARGEQLTATWEACAQDAENAQAKVEQLQTVYLPARAAMDERARQMRAAAQEEDESRAAAQKATADLYAAHGARYARHYASDVAERADTAGWKLKVKRGGPDAAATRAARDAAATDPAFVAAVAKHAASVATRAELAEQHREPNNEFAAQQREYLRIADRARSEQTRAEQARVELERHQQIRDAGLVGNYDLTSVSELREVHITEHGTNVWAHRKDGAWSRIVDVERRFDMGGSSVRFHYADGATETSHVHYGQGRTTGSGPTEVAVAAPEPGATVLTGTFVGESDSTG